MGEDTDATLPLSNAQTCMVASVKTSFVLLGISLTILNDFTRFHNTSKGVMKINVQYSHFKTDSPYGMKQLLKIRCDKTEL